MFAGTLYAQDPHCRSSSCLTYRDTTMPNSGPLVAYRTCGHHAPPTRLPFLVLIKSDKLPPTVCTLLGQNSIKIQHQWSRFAGRVRLGPYRILHWYTRAKTRAVEIAPKSEVVREGSPRLTWSCDFYTVLILIDGVIDWKQNR